MTAGHILSAALDLENQIVTGAGEEITVTKHRGPLPFIGIASVSAAGNVIEVDNGATNGVIHVIDVFL